MKLGVVGKGGTGKTTISGLLCQIYAARGQRVVAIDTDSNPNLALSLGLSEEVANNAPVVPRSLVVGSGGSTTTGRLLADYGLATPVGPTLLHAMRVEQAGAGCTCSSHASVRSLLGAVIEEEADLTLVDMEAGLEHLSRSGGTLAYADAVLVVMEPSFKSIITAARTVPLAQELGIPRIYGVGNKARSQEDHELFVSLSSEHGIRLAGVVPFHPVLAESDRRGVPVPLDQAPEVRSALESIIDIVESVDEEREGLLAERAWVEERLAQLQAEDGATTS